MKKISILDSNERSIFEIFFRYLNKLLGYKYLYVFETDVGIKYKFGIYPSENFSKHSFHEVPFEESNINFCDLILPPDYLKNRYTNCGKNIYESPHFELIEKLDKGCSIENSEYIVRKKSGTLDGRLPIQPDLKEIIREFKQHIEISQENSVTISGIRAIYKGEVKFIIADGKHRAAFFAYIKQPQALRFRFLTNDFVNDGYFRKLYSKILESDPYDYSINQEMIRSIINESFT